MKSFNSDRRVISEVRTHTVIYSNIKAVLFLDLQQLRRQAPNDIACLLQSLPAAEF